VVFVDILMRHLRWRHHAWSNQPRVEAVILSQSFCAIRWTVPVPRANSTATLRMPRPPLYNALDLGLGSSVDPWVAEPRSRCHGRRKASADAVLNHRSLEFRKNAIMPNMALPDGIAVSKLC